MDISMDIHRKPVDMDMDMDGKFHIHGKPGLYTLPDAVQLALGMKEYKEELLANCPSEP